MTRDRTRQPALDTADVADSAQTRRQFLERTGLLFCGVLGASSGLLKGCETHEEIPKISGGLRSFVTPTEGGLEDDFYVRFGNPSTDARNPPNLSPDEWSLAVTGLVDNPVTITFDDLMEAADESAITFLKTMRCVLDAPSLPLISNGYWRGVPLGPLIEQAQPQAAAVRLRISAEDGFDSNLTLSRVVDNVGDGIPASVTLLPVTLAYELNGEPIPAVHGGPVRLIVPEKFGFKNVKFPREIELTDVDEPFGYYEIDLYESSSITDEGNIEVVSYFSGPVEGEAVLGPRIRFFGMALNGASSIERVEVSVDGGSFESAELLSLDEVLADPELFFGEDNAARQEELETLRATLVQVTDSAFADEQPSVWSLWRYETELSTGRHTAEVRAFGTDGSEQFEQDAEFDNGNSSYREIRFSVRGE